MLTIGEFIQELEQYDRQSVVRGVQLDGGSYRGMYRHFYIEAGREEKVGDLIEFLRVSSTKSFEGYKGGDFQMDKDSLCFVATYGSCGLAIGGTTVEPSTGDILLNLEEY